MAIAVSARRDADARGPRSRSQFYEDGRRLTVEETLDANKEFALWVVGFTGNLRRFRRVGSETDTLDRLIAEARAGWKDVEARNGWPETPEHVPGLVPLDDLPQDAGNSRLWLS